MAVGLEINGVDPMNDREMALINTALASCAGRIEKVAVVDPRSGQVAAQAPTETKQTIHQRARQVLQEPTPRVSRRVQRQVSPHIPIFGQEAGTEIGQLARGARGASRRYSRSQMQAMEALSAPSVSKAYGKERRRPAQPRPSSPPAPSPTATKAAPPGRTEAKEQQIAGTAKPSTPVKAQGAQEIRFPATEIHRRGVITTPPPIPTAGWRRSQPVAYAREQAGPISGLLSMLRGGGGRYVTYGRIGGEAGLTSAHRQTEAPSTRYTTMPTRVPGSPITMPYQAGGQSFRPIGSL